MWVTNGRTGNTFIVLVKTDVEAKPAHRGISLFVVEKGTGPGFVVSRDIPKLGYKGLDTCEVVFDNFHVPAENLIGEAEGLGFKQIVERARAGRINVAARGVGVAQAALDDAVKYSQQRETMGKPICQHQAIQVMLAEMATPRASRAPAHPERGAEERPRASAATWKPAWRNTSPARAAHFCAMEAMRILGGYGFSRGSSTSSATTATRR